jgi:NADH oxidase (H2O2-forming)
VGKRGVLTFKTLKDADHLRKAKGKSAIVVGSGPVGIEAAVALRRKGCEVVLIELLDRILPRIFDAPMARSLKDRLETTGIQVLLAEKVIEILGEDGVEGVKTDHSTVPADLVLLVIGMKPDVELAEKGSLKLAPSGGIEVDETLGTSLRGVWACGDCVESRDRITGNKGLFMLWNNARTQGKVAGGNATGANHHYRGSLNVTTVNIFDETAASVGVLASDLPNGQAKSLHRKGPWGELWLVLHEDRLMGVQALGRTERVGGLLGLLLKGGDLKGLTGEVSQKGKGDSWVLRGVQKEMSRLIQ